MSNDAPYIMWHVDDYLGDTTHLSTVEHGAYILTMFACWKRGGSIPERHVERTARMTPEQWTESRDTLAEFFDVEDGTWTHGRIVAEIDRIEAKRKSAKRAGKASGRARKPAAEKQAKSGSQVGSGTPAERTLNERSTGVERPMNHVDVDVDVEEQIHRQHPSGVDDVARARTSPSTTGVPSEHIGYLDTLADAGVNAIRARTNRDALAQLRRWHEERVTIDEVATACRRAVETRQAANDSGPINVGLVAALVADGRRPARTRSAGAPRESIAEKAARMAREVAADYGGSSGAAVNPLALEVIR